MRLPHKGLVVFSIALLLFGCHPRFVRPATGPEKVLDHFLCYTIKEKTIDPPAGIALLDQFYEKPQPTTVITRELLCNPVAKKHSVKEEFPKLLHPEAHLVCYKIETRSALFTVKVTNQVDPNPQRIQITREHFLCLPSGKQIVRDPKEPPPNPPPIPAGGVLDHFKCYDAAGAVYKDKYYETKDEFHDGVFRNDIHAELVCNPVEKQRAGEKPTPRTNPTAHLVCYLYTTPERFGRFVKIANQFEPKPKPNDVLTVNIVPRYICMPSTKEIIPSD